MKPPGIEVPSAVAALVSPLEEAVANAWTAPSGGHTPATLALYHLLGRVVEARALRETGAAGDEHEALEALAHAIASRRPSGRTEEVAPEEVAAEAPRLLPDEARDVVRWLRDHLDAAGEPTGVEALGASRPGILNYLHAIGLILGFTDDPDIEADRRRSGFWLGYAAARNGDVAQALGVSSAARGAMKRSGAPTAEAYRAAFEEAKAVRRRGTLADGSAWFAERPARDAPPRYENDLVFAARAVAGPDPRCIRRLRSLDELPAEYPWDAVAASVEATGLKLVAAPEVGRLLEDGRLYCVDHRTLGLTAQSGLREVPAAFALSAVLGEPGHLRPLGIHDGRAWTLPAARGAPSHGAWLSARAAFSTAELAHHELYTHLGHVHFGLLAMLRALRVARGKFGEGATGRRTADLVGRLLEPHLRFVAFNMGVGAVTLVNRGGIIDQALAPDEPSGRALVRRALLEWKAGLLSPAVEVAERGCDDAQKLPYYPYRDRAAALWDACHTFVAGVLEELDEADKTAFVVAYREDIATQLDGLVRELEAEFGLGPASLPPREADLAGASLEVLVTGFISLSSFVHAAVNYPQIEHMMPVPAMPAAADPASREWMPPLDRGVLQMEVLFLLGARRFEMLGEAGYDGIPAERVRAFRSELGRLQTAWEREEHGYAGSYGAGPVPYPYLHPAVVPAAANV